MASPLYSLTTIGSAQSSSLNVSNLNIRGDLTIPNGVNNLTVNHLLDVSNLKIEGDVRDIHSNVKTTSFYDWHFKFDYYTSNINPYIMNEHSNLMSRFNDNPNLYPNHSEFVPIDNLGDSFTIFLNSNALLFDIDSSANVYYYTKTDKVKSIPKALELSTSNYLLHISGNFELKTDIEFQALPYIISDLNTNIVNDNFLVAKHAIFINKFTQITNNTTGSRAITNYKYTYDLKKGWNRLDFFILYDKTDIPADNNKLYLASLGFNFKKILDITEDRTNNVQRIKYIKVSPNYFNIVNSIDVTTTTIQDANDKYNIEESTTYDGQTIDALNNNFNIVCAIYPDTRRLFNVTEDTYQTIHATDIDLFNLDVSNSAHFMGNVIIDNIIDILYINSNVVDYAHICNLDVSNSAHFRGNVIIDNIITLLKIDCNISDNARVSNLNATIGITEDGILLNEKYVLVGARSKFTDLYVKDIDRNILTDKLLFHYKFDQYNGINNFLNDDGIKTSLNFTPYNDFTGEYTKIDSNNQTEVNTHINEIIDLNHIVGNSSLKLNNDDTLFNDGIYQFFSISTNVSKVIYEIFSIMFWMRYNSTIELNEKQYLIQINDNNLISPSYIGLYLSNINSTIYIVYDAHINNEDGNEICYNEKSILGTSIQKDIWYNITLTSKYDSANSLLNIYINGIRYDIFNKNPINVLKTSTGQWMFLFGANAFNELTSLNYNEIWKYNNNLRGNIDDFRYYGNKIISEENITSLIGKVLYVTTTGISAFGNTGIHLEPFQQKIGIGTNEPESNLHIFGDTYIEGNLKISEILTDVNINTSSHSNIYTSNITVSTNTHLKGTVTISDEIQNLSINSNYTNYGIMSNITVSTNTHLKGNVTISNKMQNLSIINNYTDYGIMSNITVSGVSSFNNPFLRGETEILNIEGINDQNINIFERKKPNHPYFIPRDTTSNLNIYGTTRFFETVRFDHVDIKYKSYSGEEGQNVNNVFEETTIIQFTDNFSLIASRTTTTERIKNKFTVTNVASDIFDINLGQGKLKSKDIETCNLDVVNTLNVPALSLKNKLLVEIISLSSVDTLQPGIQIKNGGALHIDRISQISLDEGARIIFNGKQENVATIQTPGRSPFDSFIITSDLFAINTIRTENLYTNNLFRISGDIFVTTSSSSVLNESVFYITNPNSQTNNNTPFHILYEDISVDTFILSFHQTEFAGTSGTDVEDSVDYYNISSNTKFNHTPKLTTLDLTEDNPYLYNDHYITYERGYVSNKYSYKVGDLTPTTSLISLTSDSSLQKYEILLIFKMSNFTNSDQPILQFFKYHNFSLKIQNKGLLFKLLTFNDKLSVKIIPNTWNILYITQNNTSVNNLFQIFFNGVNIGKYNEDWSQQAYTLELTKSQHSDTSGSHYSFYIDSLIIKNITTDQGIFNVLQNNEIYKYLPLIQTIDGFGFAATLGFSSSNGSNTLSADTTTDNVFLEINHGYIQTYNPLFVNIERDSSFYEGYGSLIVNTPPQEKDYFLENNPVSIFTKIVYNIESVQFNRSYPVLVLCSKYDSDQFSRVAQKVSFDISKWKTNVNASYSQLNINLSGENFLDSSDVMSIRSKTYNTIGCVGINNTNPTSNLDIVGNVRINGDLNVTTIAGNGANLTNLTMANISTTITVEKGGTGRTTFDANKLLIGNGINGITTNPDVYFDPDDTTLYAPKFTGDLAVDNITGTLLVNQGGTGKITFAENKLLIGNEANGIITNDLVEVSANGTLSADKFKGNGNELTDLDPDEIELSLNSVTNSFSLLTSAGTVTLGGTSTYIRSTLTIQIGNNASEATGNGNFTTNLFLNAANTHINSSGTIKIGNKSVEPTQTRILELNGDTINIKSAVNSVINIDGVLQVKNTIQSTENIFNIGTLCPILNIGGSLSDINIGVSGTTTVQKTVTIGGHATIQGNLNVMGATAFENLSFTHLTVTSNLEVGANATINEGLLLNNGVFLSGNRVPYIKVVSVTPKDIHIDIGIGIGSIFYGQIFNYNIYQEHLDQEISLYRFDEKTRLYNSRINFIFEEVVLNVPGDTIYTPSNVIYTVSGRNSTPTTLDWKLGDILYIFNTEITDFIIDDNERYLYSLYAEEEFNPLINDAIGRRNANNMENELLIGGNIRLMYGKLKLINSINFQNKDSIHFEHGDNTVCFTINANGVLDVYSNIDFTNQDQLNFTSNSVIQCCMTSNQFHVAGDIIAFKTEMTSDSNLKTNIQNLEYDNMIISSLRPVTFQWKDDIFNVHKRGKHEIGLIAQEVEEVIPAIVSLTKMIDGNEYKTINYNSIIPYLIQSLQHAHKKINELEMRIVKLEI